MTENDYIDGELVDGDDMDPGTRDLVESGGLPEAQAQRKQARVFNPLDAEPVSFGRQLQQRQENYDQLQMHLRGILVPDKDFGRIHVKKDCKVYGCKDDYHLSPYTLFAPGADKILGLLGLAVHYPDLQDYKRAVLKGLEIKEIIADCQILGNNGQVICEGAGACSRQEVQFGGLNAVIKRAHKRARLDAVMRLPVVSALFESDFLAQVAREAAQTGGNSTARRAQRVNKSKKWDTGAILDVCPISEKYKGQKWRDIPSEALHWFVDNIHDKPDITRAAARELTKRGDAAPGSSSTRTESPPVSSDDDAAGWEYLDDI